MANQGVRSGDTCILLLPSEQPCALLLLGTLFCGAVPLLLAPPTLRTGKINARLQEHLQGILARTNALFVIADKSFEPMRAAVQEAFPHTRFFLSSELQIEQHDSSFSPAFPAIDATAAFQLTSGTTGFPRICRWQQSNVLAALDGMARGLAVNADDICVNWTPLYHDMGLVCNFLLALSAGLPIAQIAPTDFVKNPALWLRTLSRTGATITWSPNFGYSLATARIQDHQIEGIQLGQVRMFLNAAERVHLETVIKFYNRFSNYGVRRESLRMCFGCAENIGGATFTPANQPLVYEFIDTIRLQEEATAHPTAPPENGERFTCVVSVGRPHPALDVGIINPEHENGHFLADGKVGELVLKTTSAMSEYLSEPEATIHAFQGQWLRTGDLAYLRDGELFWTGRIREQIVIRGRKIDPSEFETAIANVRELRTGCFVAFGVDDGRTGTQRLVLICELRENASSPYSAIAQDLQERIFKDLGVAASELIFVKRGSLTKTSSGKRSNTHYREQYLTDKIPILYTTRVTKNKTNE